MSDLTLRLLDDEAPEARPGHYSDRKALDILQRYFHRQLVIEDAAKQIVSMLPERADDTSRDAEIGLFGLFLCQTAQQIPYKHPAQTRLVQLIQRIATSPTFTGQADEDGFLVSYTMDNFKLQLREWWKPYLDDDPEDVDQYPHALNFSAFLARLSQCGFLSYSVFPIWMMRDALELKIDDREYFECCVSSAALWILFAGQTIFTQVVEAPDPAEADGSYKPGSQYNGPEIGLQRWGFWRNKLLATAESKETGDECRNLAYGAVELMDVIEKNMKF